MLWSLEPSARQQHASRLLCETVTSTSWSLECRCSIYAQPGPDRHLVNTCNVSLRLSAMQNNAQPSIGSSTLSASDWQLRVVLMQPGLRYIRDQQCRCNPSGSCKLFVPGSLPHGRCRAQSKAYCLPICPGTWPAGSDPDHTHQFDHTHRQHINSSLLSAC